jgi:hypothetical protein
MNGRERRRTNAVQRTAIFPGRLSRQAFQAGTTILRCRTNTKRADSVFIVMTAVNIWTPYYFVDWSALIVEIS